MERNDRALGLLFRKAFGQRVIVNMEIRILKELGFPFGFPLNTGTLKKEADAAVPLWSAQDLLPGL